MRALLDTQVLLWWLADDERLPDGARETIGGAEDAIVSVASAWEMSLKAQLGRLDFPDDLEAQLVRHQFSVLPVHLGHARRYRQLPLHHRDPFDRMLIAQAQVEELTVVSANPVMARYQVDLVPL
ncbi:MAG TPA: type II toxin-antitoxin system VapC family toxin [Acidimicrobiales bacterium]|nr:type II toxin-antitoxin system VapC family toxin [Acidimicrobiales bacterium]